MKEFKKWAIQLNNVHKKQIRENQITVNNLREMRRKGDGGTYSYSTI